MLCRQATIELQKRITGRVVRLHRSRPGPRILLEGEGELPILVCVADEDPNMLTSPGYYPPLPLGRRYGAAGVSPLTCLLHAGEV